VPKKETKDQANGRSKDGLSTKIHAMVGDPTAGFLMPGQTHDLNEPNALLPQIPADALLADKAWDADERGIEPMPAAGKSSRAHPRAIERYSAPLKRNVQGALRDWRTSSASSSGSEQLPHARQDCQKLARRDPRGRRHHFAQLRSGPN
jgi:hypothetical protein